MHACKAGILVKISKAKLEIENKVKLVRGVGPQTLRAPCVPKMGLHISQHIHTKGIVESRLSQSVIRAYLGQPWAAKSNTWLLIHLRQKV